MSKGPVSNGHDQFVIREAVKLWFVGEVVEAMACMDERGHVLAAKLSEFLAKLLQQPVAILISQVSGHLQVGLGELGVVHVVRLSPI